MAIVYHQLIRFLLFFNKVPSAINRHLNIKEIRYKDILYLIKKDAEVTDFIPMYHEGEFSKRRREWGVI